MRWYLWWRDLRPCVLGLRGAEAPPGHLEPLEPALFPSVSELEDMLLAGYCTTPVCDCVVAPEAYCRHGRPSWLLALGFTVDTEILAALLAERRREVEHD